MLADYFCTNIVGLRIFEELSEADYLVRDEIIYFIMLIMIEFSFLF